MGDGVTATSLTKLRPGLDVVASNMADWVDVDVVGGGGVSIPPVPRLRPPSVVVSVTGGVDCEDTGVTDPSIPKLKLGLDVVAGGGGVSLPPAPTLNPVLDVVASVMIDCIEVVGAGVCVSPLPMLRPELIVVKVEAAVEDGGVTICPSPSPRPELLVVPGVCVGVSEVVRSMNSILGISVLVAMKDSILESPKDIASASIAKSATRIMINGLTMSIERISSVRRTILP